MTEGKGDDEDKVNNNMALWSFARNAISSYSRFKNGFSCDIFLLLLLKQVKPQ